MGAGNGFLGSPGVFGDDFHDFPRGFDDISDSAIGDPSIGILNSSQSEEASRQWGQV